MQSSMSLMIGKGYYLQMIALLSEFKLVICLTQPSVLEILKARDAHLEDL